MFSALLLFFFGGGGVFNFNLCFEFWQNVNISLNNITWDQPFPTAERCTEADSPHRLSSIISHVYHVCQQDGINSVLKGKMSFGSPSYPSPLDRIRTKQRERAAEMGFIGHSKEASFEVNQSFPKTTKSRHHHEVLPGDATLTTPSVRDNKPKVGEFCGEL